MRSVSTGARVGVVTAMVGLALAVMVVVPTAAASGLGTSGRAPFIPTSAGPGPTPSDVPRPHPAAEGLQATQSSLNWAGYAATGTTFSSVTGSWTEPTASCPTRPASFAAFWVGLDGYAASDPTVEQIGTDSDCVRGSRFSTGGPSYYAWFEMYPSDPVELPPSSYPVAPGDTLTATVALDGSNYLLVLVDAGRWTYDTVQTPSAPFQNASAEWIAEAPTSCNGSRCAVVKLADFGAVGFSGAEADGEPVSAFANDQIIMASGHGKKVKAATSVLSPAGSAFTVSWQHS